MDQPVDKVRILVVGDSGVGKTSFVHALCHHEVLRAPSWTVGCSFEVKIHTPSENSNRSYYLEFFDVGGVAKHEKSRSVYYDQVNGMILMHDLTNRKSYANLWKWVTEVLGASGKRIGKRDDHRSASSTTSSSKKKDEEEEETEEETFDFERQIGDSGATVPMLLVGNKMDLLPKQRDEEAATTLRPRKYSLAREFGCDSISVSALRLESLVHNKEALNSFFNTVIERRFSRRQHVHYYSTAAAAAIPNSPPMLGTTSPLSPMLGHLGERERNGSLSATSSPPRRSSGSLLWGLRLSGSTSGSPQQH